MSTRTMRHPLALLSPSPAARRLPPLAAHRRRAPPRRTDRQSQFNLNLNLKTPAKQQTRVIQESLDPVWNEEFVFLCIDPLKCHADPRNCKLVVRVFDKNPPLITTFVTGNAMVWYRTVV